MYIRVPFRGLSVESQKGIITIQQYSADNQKGAIDYAVEEYTWAGVYGKCVL